MKRAYRLTMTALSWTALLALAWAAPAHAGLANLFVFFLTCGAFTATVTYLSANAVRSSSSPKLHDAVETALEAYRLGYHLPAKLDALLYLSLLALLVFRGWWFSSAMTIICALADFCTRDEALRPKIAPTPQTPQAPTIQRHGVRVPRNGHQYH